MKFYLDTANLDEIRRDVSCGIVDGVTSGKGVERFMRDGDRTFHEAPALAR